MPGVKEVRAKVVVARTTNKPGRGVVKLFLELIKQDGTVVQNGYKSMMFQSKAG